MAGSGALVNKSESEKLTLNSLRRNDKTIEEIIETANHVSLYEFQLDTKAWKRRDVEGSLFVVKRSSQPRFQYIILNRLSPST
jgi:mRNA-decapping enzyme 1B